MSWRVHTEVGPDNTIHVWPEDDAIIHDLDGTGCICGPSVEIVDGKELVSHAALDGRELTE